MSKTLDAVFMTDEEFEQALGQADMHMSRRMITQIDTFHGFTNHDLVARRQKAVDRFNSHIL